MKHLPPYAIGVIGGADGPTAIFTASRIAIVPLILIVLVVLGVVGAILLLRKK